MTDEQIVEQIHNGSGHMPAFPNLQDGQLKALLNYLHAGKDANTSHAAHFEDATNTKPQHGELESPSDAPAPASRNRTGAVTYALHCAVCHGDAMEAIVI